MFIIRIETFTVISDSDSLEYAKTINMNSKSVDYKSKKSIKGPTQGFHSASLIIGSCESSMLH